jgi:hypothetical protein
MLMPDIDTVRDGQGRTMVDGDGDRIGSIESIDADDQSGEPEWALVKDAPRVEADQHLSEAEEQQLWRHYGLDYSAGEAGRTAQPQPDTEVDRPAGAGAGGRQAGDDTAGRGVVSRSPTPTWTRPPAAPSSPSPSTRSSCTRSGPWLTRLRRCGAPL